MDAIESRHVIVACKIERMHVDLYIDRERRERERERLPQAIETPGNQLLNQYGGGVPTNMASASAGVNLMLLQYS